MGARGPRNRVRRADHHPTFTARMVRKSAHHARVLGSVRALVTSKCP
jgi:hypothetical protein